MNNVEGFLKERLPVDLPIQARKAITRIYQSYPAECLPSGLCDPMYILNIMAYELGVGDGHGNFNLKP